MSYLSGSAYIGAETFDFYPAVLAFKYKHDRDSLTPEQIATHEAAMADARRRRDTEEALRRMTCDANIPIEGMSGEFIEDDFVRVWPTGADEDIYVELLTSRCDFCEAKRRTVKIGTEEYGSMDVCQSCLNKMFDVFQAKVTE